MEIDFEKIELIYGEDTINSIKENLEIVKENLVYLVKLDFKDAIDIFERYAILFLDYDFKKYVDNLIKRIGSNYVEVLESNMELWEELM